MEEQNMTSPNVEKAPSKLWMLYSFIAMLCFLFTNYNLTYMGKAGPYLFYYFCTGQIFCGIVFNIYEVWKQHKTNGKYWTP